MNNTMQKPQTLKGFRDFLPEEKRKRDWVQSKIVEVFERFGFEPIETPTLEYAELLLGKYGDVADKLVYTFEDKGQRRVGLRYDQTVPSARVLGQYQNDLPKFFRRYQIQNVFRADKPQKGRFREFTQCDIDIFGDSSTIADADLLACTYTAYNNIGFKNITIKVNDRQTLISTLNQFANDKVDVYSIIQTIDKLDKLPKEKVSEELEKKGCAEGVNIINALLEAQESPRLLTILSSATKLGVPTESIVFDPTLARGLDYYTGMIFEITIDGYNVGSVGGGGRYDNLINGLTNLKMPAVGMAFGFDRTVEAADELGLIPEMKSSSLVLVTLFGEETQDKSLDLAARLRAAEIQTELYPTVDKLGKQFKLANQKNIPYVVLIGEEEAKNNQITLKNMKSGDQQTCSFEELLSLLK